MSERGFLGRWAQRKAQARASAQARRDAAALPASGGSTEAGVADAGATDVPKADASSGRTMPAALVGPPAQPAGPPSADDPLRAGGTHPHGPSPHAPAPQVPAHPTEPVSAQAAAQAPPRGGQPPATEALPSLDTLTPADDFAPFMRAGVDAATRNAALRTLFADPRFNVMDGLDTYIDDYSKPAPMPPAMLRTLRQARVLGLFDDEPPSCDAARPDAAPDGADSDGLPGSGQPSHAATTPAAPTAPPAGSGDAAPAGIDGASSCANASNASGMAYDPSTRPDSSVAGS